MRKLIACGVALVAAVAFTVPGALGSAEQTPGVTARSIVLGGQFSLTGPAAAYAPIPQGMKAYFAYVNARKGPDGKRGVMGRQIVWKFYDNASFIRECFAKLGKWIVSCHAKDLAFIPEMNVHFKEVVPGTGQVDYEAYLREISKLPVDAPLMLEHLQTPEEYDAGRAHIQSVGARIGVAFA